MDRFELKKLAEEIAIAVADEIKFCTKEVLTSDEAARYMGVSKSYLYKLTSAMAIPHFKPMGKVVYFNRLEIEEWLQQNRVSTTTEINDKANKILWGMGKLKDK